MPSPSSNGATTVNTTRAGSMLTTIAGSPPKGARPFLRQVISGARARAVTARAGPSAAVTVVASSAATNASTAATPHAVTACTPSTALPSG